MIYVLYDSGLDAYKITHTKRAVIYLLLNGYELKGVIEGGKEIDSIIKTSCSGMSRAGWIRPNKIIDKFLQNSIKQLPITIGEHLDTVIISLTDKKNFRYPFLKHEEYQLPIDKINNLFKELAKFHLKGNFFHKNEEVFKILLSLEQFKND